MLMNASICAAQPLWSEPIYNVTKAALLMFGKCLSIEMVKRNIRVNTVNPGLIRTPDWEKTARELAGDRWEDYLQKVADDNADIRRFGTIEELADFCVFLCSSRASYSVGSAYHVDGGMLRTV
jgi:NAD(P)-dependent dehydrogenase (short-subunit alcohol dehydrogenase family)